MPTRCCEWRASCTSEVKGGQLQNLLAKSISFFQNQAAGRILFSFFNDSNSIGALLSIGLLSAAMHLIYTSVRLGILWYIDPILTLAYLSVVPFQIAADVAR